jgi:hypothetical protein
VRYESGGLKGQRLACYDIVAGPGAGGELRCGTFRAPNLAGPRASVVATDEPLPEDVFNELWPRLLGRNGRMYQTFTPTIGTAHKLDYLWAMVDDPSRPWAGQIQTELTLEAVTPRGGLVDVSWMSQEEIDRFASGYSRLEQDMRMGRTRTPLTEGAYFSAWHPGLIRPCRPGTPGGPPAGMPLGIGIDHGSKPGAQRATLVAVGGVGIHARVWVLGHYRGDGRTESEQDARGILDMIERAGVKLEDIDRWIGDRAHGGDRRGGAKSNFRLQQAIAEALKIDTGRRRWTEKLPEPLRKMRQPDKYSRSIWEGCEILHRTMIGADPQLCVDPSCVPLIEDFGSWQGSTRDPHKDGLDSARYIIVPMVENKDR